MGFLKRLLGGGGTSGGGTSGGTTSVTSGTRGSRGDDRGTGRDDRAPDARPATPADVEADERAYDLELARAEQERLTDLQQRQLRYADYAWTPPAQGGERRADDADRRADADPTSRPEE